MATPIGSLTPTMLNFDSFAIGDERGAIMPTLGSMSPHKQHPGIGLSESCDHFMFMNVEHLARSVTTLSNAMQSLEMRQVNIDEQLAALHGNVQSLQEEHSVLAARQDMVADVVQQKKQHASGDQLSLVHQGRPCGTNGDVMFRLDDQEHRLTKLGVDVHLLASRIGGPSHVDGLINGAPRAAKEANSIAERLLELEKGQKKVLIAAQKALQLAMGLQQEQRLKFQQHESLELLAIETGSARSSSTSHENVASADAKSLLLRMEEQDKALVELRRSCNNLQDLREHVGELQQAVIFNLASHHSAPPVASRGLQAAIEDCHSPGGSGGSGRSQSDSLVTMVQAMQARVDRNLDEMSNRLDSLLDVQRNQNLQASKHSKQVPDMTQKIEHLWGQCQFYFSKVKEHDVQINFMSGENVDQKLLALDCGEGIQFKNQNGKRQPQDLQRLRPLPLALQQSAQEHKVEFGDCCDEPSSPTSSLSISISSASALTGTMSQSKSLFAERSSVFTAADCGGSESFRLSSPSNSRVSPKNGEASLELFGRSSIFNSASSQRTPRHCPDAQLNTSGTPVANKSRQAKPFGSEFHGC